LSPEVLGEILEDWGVVGSKAKKERAVAHRAKLCSVDATREVEHPMERQSEMMIQPGMDATNCDDSPWWALYTRHQHEKTVADMLTAKGFEVFLPLYESMRRWKDRKKMLSLPLFPCYVFVRGGLNRRLQVVTTPGVHMILSHGESFAVIPEAEIEVIRRTIEGSYRVEPHPYLRVGERVRVIRGTLEGVEGVLLRKKNMCRLVLSVAMVAQSVAVEIDAADVEPVIARDQSREITAGQSMEAGKVQRMLTVCA
jgi:transcription antitermination factor NusG